MIKIIAGGKKHPTWLAEVAADYEKRLQKPYAIEWLFMDEARLAKYLEKWPFAHPDHFVIVCDERGENISSPVFSDKLTGAFMAGKDIVILIGGAYGFAPEVRSEADFLWSFSKLVFPHSIARLIAVEQIYRAQEIAKGSSYHHE